MRKILKLTKSVESLFGEGEIAENFLHEYLRKKSITISAPLDLRSFQGDQGPQGLPNNMQQGMLLQRPVFKMNPTNEFWDQSRISSETTPTNPIPNANNATINRTIGNNAHTNSTTNNIATSNATTNNISNQPPQQQSSNLLVNSQSMLPPSSNEPVNSTSRTPDTSCNQNLPISNFNSQDTNTNSTPNTNNVDNQSIESTNMNQNNALALPDHKIMTEKLVSELQVR